MRDLYVTKVLEKALVYPEVMGPPPEWANDTPKNFCFNAMVKFQTDVKSAFKQQKEQEHQQAVDGFLK